LQSAVILDSVTDTGTTTSTEHEVVWLRPSPRLGIMRRVEVFAATGLAAAIVGVMTAIGFVVGGHVNLAEAAALIVAITLAGVLSDRWAQRRVRAWAYCEREDDLLVRRGVMVSRLSVIPYGRMQFIDVIAGPIERAFSLATVRMHTAAASSDARIPGLTQVEAARLRDHLAQLGEAKAAGL
jgi:membrane protein YdbS with pleckstrin-like domain